MLWYLCMSVVFSHNVIHDNNNVPLHMNIIAVTIVCYKYRLIITSHTVIIRHYEWIWRYWCTQQKKYTNSETGIVRILCFVDCASLYNLVNKANLVHKFLSMFISFIYMFRATMCPSSGEITVSMRHLVFVTLCGWLSGMKSGIHCTLHTRESSTQSDKYRVSHRYSYFSWWWAHFRTKHVEKINKHSKKFVHQFGFINKTCIVR
jgi:hypothetical protein